MSKPLLQVINPELVEEHPAYLLEWQAKRGQTLRVIDFIRKVLRMEKMNQNAITKRLRMGNGQLRKVLDCPVGHILSDGFINRLAVGIVTLLPDLNKSERLQHLCHDKTYPYAVCRINDDGQLAELRQEFIDAFAPMGSHLVNDLKDLGQAMKALDDYHHSYSNI